MGYKNFFGFQKEPFSQEIRLEDLYPLPGLHAATERFLYALNLGAVSIITGDVGSGKSTALRYAAGKLHPSQYKVVSIVAVTGSIADIMRQLCNGFDVEGHSNSLAKLTRTLRSAIMEITQRKQTPVLIIDEASLMRLEIFAQLHTISQFEMDSKPLLPIVLAGQNNLIDKLLPCLQAACLTHYRPQPSGRPQIQRYGRIHQTPSGNCRRQRSTVFR